MRVREACTSPLVHTEARLYSTRTSVAQKEGQNFSHLALFAGVSHGRIVPSSVLRGVIKRWSILSADLLCNPIHFP
jgi:hypothetical protein